MNLMLVAKEVKRVMWWWLASTSKGLRHGLTMTYASAGLDYDFDPLPFLGRHLTTSTAPYPSPDFSGVLHKEKPHLLPFGNSARGSH